MPALLDDDARYMLAPDIAAIQRDRATVQIGFDDPRRMLLVDAPGDTVPFLSGLSAAPSLAEAYSRSPTDPAVWRTILLRLLATDLLVPVAASPRCPPRLAGVRMSLIHDHGYAAAGRMITARSDAVVTVVGDGPLPESIAHLLTDAGIGRVHLDGDRSAQRRSEARSSRTALQRPASPDPDWQAAAPIAWRRPAPQNRPTAVVLAGTDGPDPGRAAELVATMVPHLAVRVTPARVIVGPLVLPGRSACLNCVERHRVDADPGWPAVAATRLCHAAPTGPLATGIAADLTAGQVLALVDGRGQPDTVGGTLERRVSSVYPHRRAWPMHRDCGCRRLTEL